MMKHFGKIAIVLAFAGVVLGASARPAHAFLPCPLFDFCPMCEIPENQKTREKVTDEHNQQRDEKFGTSDPLPPERGKCQQHGTRRLGQDQNWWMDVFLNKGEECDSNVQKSGKLLHALQLFTEEMTVLAMHHTLAVGTMMDAHNQLNAQLTFERLKARAHKDYHPSMGMCIIGTNMRSMGAAERNAVLSSVVFNNRNQDRILGAGDISSALGPADDIGNRTCNFKYLYCDSNDNNRLDNKAETGLELMCNTPCRNVGNTGPEMMVLPGKWMRNKDIDFTRTIMNPKTLGIDFTDPYEDHVTEAGIAGTDPYQRDKESVFGMANNLFSNRVLGRMTQAQLKMEDAIDEIVDYRSLAAQSSVAQHSFDAIVGLKAMGTDKSDGDGLSSADTYKYMSIIMQDMGMTEEDITRVLGPQIGSGEEGYTRPSYFAQLEFIAKTLYQRAEFYTDLYEKPANIERKRVAMQAINSVLDREIYNSQLRSEAIISQILELGVEAEQSRIEGVINGLPVQN